MSTDALPTPEIARAPVAEDKAWLTVAERGSVFGIRLLFWICKLLGRTTGRLVLRPLMLYYVLTHGVARAASRQYLERVGLPTGLWQVYRHFLCFAEVELDRIFLLQGRFAAFDIGPGVGHDHLERLMTEQRGAILLGGHLGSVEAARAQSDALDIPLHVLTHTGNARINNSFLETLNPELAGRVVEAPPGGIDAVLKVKELVDSGKLVAMLGDRVGLNDKTATVDFLGKPARMPTGAYLLSALCRCPIYLTFGLYTAPNRYQFFCEPFLDQGLELPRGDRERLLAIQAQRFAQRLEVYCRKAPLNWFNFYDFWGGA